MKKWWKRDRQPLELGGVGSAADAEAVRSAGEMRSLKATSVPVRLELEAFNAVTDGDYPGAVLALRAMSARDRAVLVFWLRELTGMSDDVDLSEKRWSVE